MKAFRFRLARLLEIRERAEEERREALELARAALRETQQEIARVIGERTRVQSALTTAEGPDIARRLRDLLLYEDHLRALLERQRTLLVKRQSDEALALAALHTAVKERKILIRLRDKRLLEYTQEVDRVEQSMNDEVARRLWREGARRGGSDFPSSRNELPGTPQDPRDAAASQAS
ncbi:MAG: hypothetical protein ACKVU1_09265 [bacterium]